jgi:hypothetical protein
MYRVYKRVQFSDSLSNLEKISDRTNCLSSAMELAKRLSKDGSEYRIYTSKKLCSFKLVFTTKEEAHGNH